MHARMLDTETRSLVDLPKAGAHKYAAHPGTEVLMTSEIDLSPGLGHGEVYEGPPRHVDVPGITWAWNSEFDRNVVGGSLESWRDLMMVAAMLAYPLALGRCAVALGLTGKHDAGTALINRFSKPMKDGAFRDMNAPAEAERKQKFLDYCMQDTALAADIFRAWRPYVDEWLEHHEDNWLAIERMNLRGIPVDADEIREVQHALDDASASLTEEFRAITGFSPMQPAKLTDLLGTENAARETLEDWLEANPDAETKLRRAVQIRLIVSRASTKKLQKMLDMVMDDGRVRGCFIYHGARTGRCAARGIQPQNLKRGSPPDGYWDSVRAGALLQQFPDLHGATSQALRSFIKTPDGSRLVVGDYKSIEARVLATLAGDQPAVDRFRRGEDTYVAMAADIFEVEPARIDKNQRFIGKGSELGSGYQASAGALADQCISQAKSMGLPAPPPREHPEHPHDRQRVNPFWCRVTRLWRRKHQPIVQWWRALDEAAVETVATGRPHGCFAMDSHFLTAALPSGRRLFYPQARVKVRTIRWKDPETGEVSTFEKAGVEYTGQNLARQWVGLSIYGGKWAENITQAVAADLIHHALKNAEFFGLAPIMIVHDELVCCDSMRDRTNQQAYDLLERAMLTLPDWAVKLGIPVEVEGYVSERYRK